jgi:hypothetical protein
MRSPVCQGDFFLTINLLTQNNRLHILGPLEGAFLSNLQKRESPSRRMINPRREEKMSKERIKKGREIGTAQ